ncbi:MAG: VCBS repeat-containing protein, partial [Moheibacter sp.]
MKKTFFFVFSFIFCFLKSQSSFNETEVISGATYNFEYLKSIGDIDNDGYPEILIETDNTFTPNYDYYYLSNENGDLNYYPRVYLEPVGNIYIDFFYDIDNDGLIDLVGRNGLYNPHYYWRKNLGNRVFSNSWVSLVYSNINYFSSNKFYDYNNDNFVDYFVTTNQGEVFRYTNLQGNGFSSPELVFYTDDTFRGTIEEISFLDFNQDGFEDLLVRSFFTNFDLYLNNGNDYFEYHIPIEDQATESQLDSFDFDGNSINDFVIYDKNSLKIRTFFYDEENGEYYSHDELIDTPFTHVLSNAEVVSKIVDFNQDGLMDIFITTGPSNGSYSNVYYYEGIGNQEFAEKKLIRENLFGDYEFILTDLNSDNKLDILMNNRDSYSSIGVLYALYNEGNLNFKETIVEQNLNISERIFFADINNDDKIDIINGNSNLIWYENRGDNDWSGRRFIPSVNSNPGLKKDFEIIDFNNDNLPDIISNRRQYNSIGNSFSIYKNLGNSEFEKIYNKDYSYLDHWDHYGVYTNGNSSFPDIYFIKPIWTPNMEGQVFIMKNNNGVFEEPVQAVIQYDGIPFVTDNFDFDLADLNNDGLPELIYFNFYYDNNNQPTFQLAYLENLGNDTFSKNEIISSTQSIIGHLAFPLDYDSDGDLDIIVGKYSLGELSVFENENMTFTKKIIDNNVIVDDVLVHDVNNDGLPDILTLGYYKGGSGGNGYNYQFVIYYYENKGNGQ